MENYKKLSEELLKIDGIDPASVSNTERAMFKAMLDKEMKHFNRLSWLSVSLLWIFFIALLGLCLSERALEVLHIPFVIAWAIVIIGMYVILIFLWPNHFRKIKASGKKVQRLRFIVHGKYRGFPLVGKKDGKIYIDWLSIILLVIALWLIISLGSAGVYYLLCRRWVFSTASGSAFHIFFMTIMSLAFVMPLLYRGLKAPLEELTEIKAENYSCSRRKFSIITVAVIIIAAVLSISLWDKSIPTAYAIEQTIEAMRKVTTVHCFGKTFTEEQIEMWIEVNPETGENEKFYLDSPEATAVATKNESYMYQKPINVVIHTKIGISTDVRFGRVIEDMIDVSNSNSKAKLKISEIDGEKPVILLVVETDEMILECKVDPDTKLPMSMHYKPKKEPLPGALGQSIDEIYYNEPLPEGIFEFEIPEGAQVREQ